jgi:hypothetical protein
MPKLTLRDLFAVVTIAAVLVAARMVGWGALGATVASLVVIAVAVALARDLTSHSK